MAANMSPEMLKLLQDRDAQFYNKSGAGNYIQQDGRYYQPVYAGGGGGGEGGLNDPGVMSGFHGYDQSWADGGKHQGEFGQRYDAGGKFTNDYAWKDDEAAKNLMIALAAAGGMAMLPGGAFAGAGSGAGAGAGFVGEGAMSGIPAWDGALSTSLSGAYGPAGLATAAGQGAGPAAATTAASSGGGGGIFNTVTKAVGGSNGLLGIGSSILGGILGGKGQEGEQSTTQRWDPRLDAYLFGDGGLFNLTQQAMQRSQSPQRLAEADRIRQMGLNMLSTPAARNPFGG